MKRAYPGLLFAISVILCTTSTAQIPQEAVDGWKEMESLLDPLQFDYSCKLPDRQLRFRCAFQGPLMKCEYFKGTDISDSPHLVALRNEEGVYLLEKPGRHWQLTDARQPSESIFQLERVVSVPRIGFSLDAKVTLLDAANQPSKYVLKNSTDEEGTWNLSLEYLLPDGKKELAAFELDPAKRFRIRSVTYSETDGSDPATYEFSYSDDSLIGEVVPNSWFCNTAKSSWKINTLKHAPLAKEEYSLEFYGLPEYRLHNALSGWLLASLVAASIVVITILVRTRRAK